MALDKAPVGNANAESVPTLVACPLGETAIGDRADAPDAYNADVSECATYRERSVAGRSDVIPTCPIHGVYPDDTTDAYWRNYRNGEGE